MRRAKANSSWMILKEQFQEVWKEHLITAQATALHWELQLPRKSSITASRHWKSALMRLAAVICGLPGDTAWMSKAPGHGWLNLKILTLLTITPLPFASTVQIQAYRLLWIWWIAALNTGAL